MRTRRATSAETLIRWNHLQQGLLAPDRFIPLTERTGLIRPITYWVIETAARQCKAWRNAGHPLRVAVNMPGRVFHDPDLSEKIERALHEADIPVDCLDRESHRVTHA